MKKIFGISVIALFISLLFVPLNVNAEDALAEIFGSNVSMTKTTEDENTFSIEQPKSGDTKLYIGVNVKSGTFTELKAHVELKNSSFTFNGGATDFTPSSGWKGTATKSADGNGIDIDITNETGLPAGTRKIVATIVLDVDEGVPSDETCMITISKIDSPEPTPTTPENPKCQIVDDIYYDANGNEVSKEAYEKACVTSENPQTGSFLPYTLIIAGLALAGWLYYVTKKNNKMYQV